MMDLIHAFYEGYINGFTVEITKSETVMDWLGNAVYMIIHLGGLL